MDLRIVQTVSLNEEVFNFGFEEEEKLEQVTTCEKCEIQVDAKEFVRHLANQHFQCSHCKLALGSKSAVWQHLLLVHNQRIFQDCKKCGKKFAKQSELDIHNTEIHSTPSKLTKKYECEICFKTFEHKQNVLRHKQEKHKGSEKKYQCQKCEYKTHIPGFLEKHRQTHLASESQNEEIEFEDTTL